MSLTRREAAARLMEHMCKHDGNGGHGYSQIARMGNGVPESVNLGDGCVVTIAGGDRDCSSGIITVLRAVGINTYGASYTGNMRSQLTRGGQFIAHPRKNGRCIDGYIAKRGDIYLNESHHTAMCVSASPDRLAQFSISENGTISGKVGDQTGKESNIRNYYSYPWNVTLSWANDGGTIGDVTTPESYSVNLGDKRYWGPMYSREFQKQMGTYVDGIISDQPKSNRQYIPNADTSSWSFENYVDEGSALITAVQKKIGAGVDGFFGYESAGKLQEWLNRNCSAGLTVDHIFGIASCTALGNALESKAFTK